jgi:hypothetical protein
MVAISLIVVTVKRLIMFCVLALAVWHITASLSWAKPYGKVLVYVSEQPSVLTVDRQHYLINPQMAYPLICELSPGEHVLRLERKGEKIYEETFSVEAHREQTIFAPKKTAARFTPPPVVSPSVNPEPAVAPPVAIIPVHRAAYRHARRDEIQPVSEGN